MSTANHSNPSFQLLLNTTEQLIAEKGCRNTTLQDIIQRSGLSKGAIYHYVQGKDELYGRLMQSKMDLINERFNHAVENSTERDMTQMLHIISEGFIRKPDDVTNQIFVYLLGQRTQPGIAKILHEFYEHSLQTSVSWIESGQLNGVIPIQLDAKKMANLFITFGYGMRVHAMVSQDEQSIEGSDVFRMLFAALKK